MHNPKTGTIGWIDLTVPNAGRVRDFYVAVVGWKSSDVSMGDYADYCVSPPAGGDPVAGICHARGPNMGIPPQWLIYINVDNLDESIKRCRELGGIVVCPERDMGSGRMCIIQDPAGAVAALFEARS